MPSCFFGIIAYVTLEEQQIEKNLIKCYFSTKRFVTILWTFEAISVSITGYINTVPFSSLFTIISISLAGILLDCFFLYFIWKCFSYLEKEEPFGSIVTLSESSITNYPTASTIVIAIEIKEVQGDIEITKENEIKPCKPVIHDFTMTDSSIHTDDNVHENKA
ncbi:hypothetical protein SteCoe_30037 [Stentor coeruleus]|uniref:Uncharacterized protein n=1 Tax=Stentor coeruleus TaxID=5963 RepID=A0A1R2B4F2_9CILI|nr:hypothetical protein SteCoe_30037 [Stentor coeruleus]